MKCPKCDRVILVYGVGLSRAYTVGKHYGRGAWKPWVVKDARHVSKLKLCKPCAQLEASARNNRRRAKLSPSVLTAAMRIGEFLGKLGRPDDSVYRAVITMTEEFYLHVEALEVDSVRSYSPAGQQALAKVWEAAERIEGKRPRYRVTLDLTSLQYLIEIGDFLAETWRDEFGSKGKALARYMKNLKPKLEALLP